MMTPVDATGTGLLGPLVRLRLVTGGLDGWRQFACAALLGAIATLGMPPVNFWPFYGVALVLLLWLIAECDRFGRVFALGLVFGTFHFLTGLYWVAEAFLVEAEKFAWMIPFLVGGLAVLLALFHALGLALTWRLARAFRLGPVGWVLLFALLWTAAEWVRGHIFTGFPWNLAGHVWSVSASMIQIAALTGVYGLSLITVAALAMPAVLGARPRPRREEWVPAALAGMVLLALFLGGAWRLHEADAGHVEGVTLRIVQPNVDQRVKWRPEEKAVVFRQLLELSTATGYDAITHIIWPETATPFFLEESPQALDAIAAAVPPGGALITGTPRRTPGGAGEDYWNGLVVVDGRGEVTASFDKFHLVPFGEYVPLRDVLPVERLAAGRGSFSFGSGPRTLEAPGLPPFSPLICYEAIFPAAVTAPAGEPQPDWLLNVTNDAWFGTSTGPYQHLMNARMRAVEEGLPMIRAANTGISAVIDPFGRIEARLDIGRRGVIDHDLPTALSDRTVYARFGDTTLLLLAVLVTGLIVLTRIGRRRAI
jgi:apolipoprotein N-acyltransferase